MTTAGIEPPLRASALPDAEGNLRRRSLFFRAARAEGFRRIGVAAAGPAPRASDFEAWLDAGMHGSMTYLERSRRLRADARALLPEARSVVVLADAYQAGDPAAPDGTRTARYALAEDYHRTLRARCERVVAAVRGAGVALSARICVDSAPLAERAFAAAAGIGWIGKNGMLMNAEDGSWLLLCAIVTDLALPADSPAAERCGSCTRCLDACPTGAFPRPGVVDANRCLSYWTIEQRGAIPESIARQMDGWVFGCDVCQEVCPYNAAIETGTLERRPPSLAELLETGAAEWKRRFGDTPVARAGAAGMRRNAAAVAEARGDPALLPVIAPLAAGKHPIVAAQAARAVRALDAR
ncbi:MAG TPA: tRNA epoxyqueuosine(34) reductase QueG [Thermoanaerobaculia bacterium]|nr:tRNA epoxyqueuosine(34) reductase QueG [Thermoanaerobaculia bacterium]